MTAKARALLVAVVLAAVALAQVPGVAMASSGHSAMQDMVMSQADGGMHGEADCAPDCAMLDGNIDADCEGACAMACASATATAIIDVALSSISAPELSFDTLADISGNSALSSGTAPPPRL